MLSNLPASPSLSLTTYLGVLRRQRRLIAVVAILTAVLGMLPALLEEPVYTSTASVRVSTLDQEGVFRSGGGGDNLPSDRARELATEMEILQSSPVQSAVLARLGEDTPDFERPVVTQVGYSEIIEITITAGDAATAADVANTFAEVFIQDRRTRSVEGLVEKANELQEQGAEATAELEAISQQLANPELPPNEVANLQVRQTTLASQAQEFSQRADELGVEAALRGRGTQVISPAELELEPLKGSPIAAGFLGLILGALLGLAIAVVADTAQDQLGSRADLASVRPDAPVLAAVPHADFRGHGGRDDFSVQEAYRYLRTGIRVFGLNADLKSVIVTSAVSAEGKSTTAVNLALAMAEAGDRVVLVDCDLRRPTIHTFFDLDNVHGLSSVVVDDVPLDRVISFVQPNLAIVSAGPSVQNPTEMLGSRRFAAVLEAIVAQADFTILDSPPVLPVADALIAGQLVDGAIVVSRIGGVRRRSIRDLLGRLEEARIPLVGLVANDVAESAPENYYTSTRDGRPKEPATT